jgi:hypothetical protein
MNAFWDTQHAANSQFHTLSSHKVCGIKPARVQERCFGRVRKHDTATIFCNAMAHANGIDTIIGSSQHQEFWATLLVQLTSY